MRVRGWSVSWRDAVAVACVPGGIALALTSHSVGEWTVEVTAGSLLLGVVVVIAMMLAGFVSGVAGVLYLVSARRTYRHPMTLDDELHEFLVSEMTRDPYRGMR